METPKHLKRTRRDVIYDTIVFIILTFILLIVAYPLYFVIISSFSDPIAVAGGKDGRVEGLFPPCGVCRQVMAEFCPPDFPVLVATPGFGYRRFRLDELLPNGFDPSYMNL